jgi:ribosomal protein S18 acetylase RimI-like enzyme
MENEVSVYLRDAGEADMEALTTLIADLGYPTTIDEIHLRFQNIFKQNGFRTLLAIADDGQPAGFIGMSASYGYEHNAIYIRVLALAVAGNYRNRGIGRILMDEAEKWGTELNAYMIVLTSGLRDERKAAYAFYQSIGYEIKSSGFVKKLKNG